MHLSPPYPLLGQVAPLGLTVGEGLERLMVGPFTSFGVRGETHEPHPLEFFFIAWGVGNE